MKLEELIFGSQTSTRKATRALDTTVATSSLINLRGYARTAHSTPLVLTRNYGGLTFKVRPIHYPYIHKDHIS